MFDFIVGANAMRKPDAVHKIFAEAQNRAKHFREVVHIANANDGHIVEGPDPCWCETTVRNYENDGGGVLVIHTTPTWH